LNRFEEPGVQRLERARHDRLDQPLAAAEVVQHRGMRDADVSGDLLDADARGPVRDERPFCRVEDGRASLLARPSLA
jgi:hypothetical protein